MDSKEVLERIKQDEIKFISFQFTDVNGVVKSVDCPIYQVENALKNGVWFDGSSVEGFARIQESDMRLVVDPDTYAILPWTPVESKRARILCDIYHQSGEPFDGDPRGVLKRKLAKLKEEHGWVYNVGPEPEFFLFLQNGKENIHPVPHDIGGYFDFSANDDAVLVRTELMEALSIMGLEIEMGHHEVALGQHEIDFRFADALRTADNVLTLKYVVKAIAAQHGLIASFMPKPVFGINGSGMHCHQSIFSLDGKNLFFDGEDPFKLSVLAHQFIAGQLDHARAMAAVVAPTVNSYKRLVPGYEAPDPSTNPYLAFNVMQTAGLDGIEKGLDCPEPLNQLNVYELSEEKRQELGIGMLPGSLSEALSAFESDALLKTALGKNLTDAFLKARKAEWEEFRMNVTDWELSRYLTSA
jgi:glutamine synthetase